MQGIVEGVSVYCETDTKFPIWWFVKLADVDKPVLLHQNWMSEYGALKAGDKVECELSGSTMDGYPLFSTLKVLKVEKDVVSLMGESQK